jgi:subtilisin family serine protease
MLFQKINKTFTKLITVFLFLNLLTVTVLAQTEPKDFANVEKIEALEEKEFENKDFDNYNNTLIVGLKNPNLIEKLEEKVYSLNSIWKNLDYDKNDLQQQKNNRQQFGRMSEVDEIAENSFTTFKVKEEKDISKAIQNLEALSEVKYVQKVTFYEKFSYTPAVPNFNEQWQLMDANSGIKAQSGWTRMGQILRNTTDCASIKNDDKNCGGDKNIKIAVIDSGVHKNALPGTRFDEANSTRIYNSNLNNGSCSRPAGTTDSNWKVIKIQEGLCMGIGAATLTQSMAINGQNWTSSPDIDGHGTAVASVIGMADNNDSGIGVAHNTTIVGIGMQSYEDRFTSLELIRAIDRARIGGANVINLSLGGPVDYCDIEEGGNGFDQGIREAVQRATNAGVVVVAASGNEGNKIYNYNCDPLNLNRPEYNRSITNPKIQPAYFPETISVGATNSNNTKSDYSTYNDRVDVVAPVNGVDGLKNVLTKCGIVNINCNAIGNIRYSTGTSFAAPQVAGVAGLLLSINNLPNRSPEYIKGLITSAADDLGSIGKDNSFGWGLLNVDDTLKIRFPDVPKSHDFDIYIHNLKFDDIIDGYPDGTYKPNNNVDRGAMAKFIKNGFNIPTNTTCGDFPDVKVDNDFYTEITSLKCANVIGGYPDGNYKPSNKVIRSHMAKFIVNGSGMETNTTCPQFSDIPANNEFGDMIRTLKCNNVIGGYPDGTYKPNNVVIRSHMAKFVDNARKL